MAANRLDRFAFDSNEVHVAWIPRLHTHILTEAERRELHDRTRDKSDAEGFAVYREILCRHAIPPH